MPDQPKILVFTTLFPSAVQPGAGLFIRERMFRVGKILPVTVVAPVPWFPLQGLIRFWRPHYRPMPPLCEQQDGIEVLHPRFLAIPGLFRQWDGFLMALSCLPALRRLKRTYHYDIVDAHFAYPDGYAATLLGRWLNTPVTITLRGTEVPHAGNPAKRKRMLRALENAVRVFSVSASLKRHVANLGADERKIFVVGNGVDAEKFFPIGKSEARGALNIPDNAKVLVSVGGLVERKGFHRVIEAMPKLVESFPGLVYLVVGGPSAEGDMTQQLRDQVTELGLHDHVRFTGPVKSDRLSAILSAADIFVLSTRNEGWANVFLEAMACGLPVITTDVGGNREVVVHEGLGKIVPFGDAGALSGALHAALEKTWDNAAIIRYARDNAWDNRVSQLVSSFNEIAALHQRPAK